MRIAVTYDASNGEIFGHFGKTEAFKIYEVHNNEVVNSVVLGTNGSGHSALSKFLYENGVDVLICGGIGGGAQNALNAAGILLFPGHSGQADDIVKAFLNDELQPSGANCDHHHEDGHHCCGEHDHDEDHECTCGGDCADPEPEEECDCDGDCSSGGCGGCCGGAPQFEGPNVGKQVKVHYRGTFDNGEQFDSSYDRGEPLAFTCGGHQMILGFDRAVATMEVGQIVNVHLEPEDAYGPVNPYAVMEFRFEDMPGSEELEVGQRVYLMDQYNRPTPVKVVAKTETSITFDANHEMAGKSLNFQIELVSVEG